jgi:hypothetical protein
MPPRLKQIARRIFSILVWMTCVIALVLYPLRLVRKLLSRRVFSLWTGTPILTLPTKARAERLLGVNAKTLVFSTYYITDEFDYNLSRLSAVPVIGRLLPLPVFLWACVMVDRLHSFCDRGILPPTALFTYDFRELWIYRILGIDVFLWAYGADVRNESTSRAMGEPNPCSDCTTPGKYCICDAQRAAENMRKLSMLSRAIFAGMGEMFGYTPGSIDNVFYWPLDLESERGRRYQPVFPDANVARPLRIVHASNHRMFKGTRFLIDAVDQLKAEGEQIELVLVEGVPNVQALELYKSADVIFDQCLMGNYGFFALEAMALGKPVMCFIRHPEQYLLHPEECPIINVHVSSLKDDIRAILRRRTELTEIGKRGRRYVETYFSVKAFAQRLGEAYDLVAPDFRKATKNPNLL